MTIELLVENEIVTYLKENLNGIEIQPLNDDIVELVLQCKRQPNGIVTVSHSNVEAVYEMTPQAYGYYQIAERYTITVMTNDRRSKDGLYEYMAKIRDIMIGFSFKNRRARQVSHIISPEKFPDIKEGVHIGEMEYEIIIKYPIN